MRTRTRMPIAIAAFLTLALTGTASATHEGIHPTFRSERVYFHCAGLAKLQNVGIVTDGTPSWDTTAPADSFQDGAGCGTLDPGAARGTGQETIYDLAFSGKFTGNLQNLTVQLHNLALGRIRQGAMFVLRVRMSIDGVFYFPETVGNFVNVAPVADSNGVTDKFVFSITGLGCASEVRDADGNVVDVKSAGLAKDDGDGTTEHQILITIDSGIVGQSTAGQTVQPQNSLWVWDSTEVPAGITFNPSTLEGNTVPVENSARC